MFFPHDEDLRRLLRRVFGEEPRDLTPYNEWAVREATLAFDFAQRHKLVLDQLGLCMTNLMMKAR